MEAVEIVLVVIGLILVGVTYFLSEKFEMGTKDIPKDINEDVKKITRELVVKEVEYELANVIDDKVEAAAVELDKITNEKIMAFGNYSKETMETINSNHNEVMFLYNMLNEKEETLKDTVRDIEALKLSIKKLMSEKEHAKNKTEKKAAKTEESKEEVKQDKKTEKKPENRVREQIQFEVPKLDNMDELSISEENQINIPVEEYTTNNNEVILGMHEQGKSKVEIAKALGIGVGEVSLVIDLFK